MKIKKNQWILLGLSLALCFGLYLNWRFISDSEQVNSDKILGEAQYVSTKVEDVSKYFTQSRLTRQRSKEDAIDLLETVIASADSSESAKQQANKEKMAIAANNEEEATIENLIKAKGFVDCVAFISEECVNVVVPGEGIGQEQVAQIQEIVVSETGVKPSKVKIVEVKS